MNEVGKFAFLRKEFEKGIHTKICSIICSLLLLVSVLSVTDAQTGGVIDSSKLSPLKTFRVEWVESNGFRKPFVVSTKKPFTRVPLPPPRPTETDSNTNRCEDLFISPNERYIIWDELGRKDWNDLLLYVRQSPFHYVPSASIGNAVCIAESRRDGFLESEAKAEADAGSIRPKSAKHPDWYIGDDAAASGLTKFVEWSHDSNSVRVSLWEPHRRLAANYNIVTKKVTLGKAWKFTSE